MKRKMLLCLAVVLLLSGCALGTARKEAEAPAAQMVNPWSGWGSLDEAEAAVGFPFGLPPEIDGFTADSFRTMEQSLIEICYSDGDYEVCVRKSMNGEADISGDYNRYEQCETQQRDDAEISIFRNEQPAKILVRTDSSSWSLLSPDGYPGDAAEGFLSAILQAP